MDKSLRLAGYASRALRALRAAAPLAALFLSSATSTAGPCTPPVTNPIVCENSLTGNPASEWDVSGAGDASIQGFATRISVNHGETVRFKVKTNATAWHLDVYRLGYYGGDGARLIAGNVLPTATLPQTQPACLNKPATGLNDCGNWAESASWAVPATPSRGSTSPGSSANDTLGASHVVFIVRDDEGHSPLLFQTSDTTWQAYNQYGGNSLYVGGPGTNPGRAYKVSYNRPFTTRGTSAEDWLFNSEYPMVRWLEANGYNVSYFTGVDSARRGAEILEHQVFLSVGHDEYWSAGQRANVEAARTAGKHLAFFSGNEVFWKTRWEPSIDASATAVPHARLLQGDARRREDRPERGVDGDVARQPRDQPSAESRERADGPDLHRQLLQLPDDRRRAGRQDASLAQYPRRQPDPGADGHLPRGHGRVRVGRGPRQRLASRRDSSACPGRPSTSPSASSTRARRTVPAPRRTA